MGEKISIIVPIYKVERYLEQCLDSIVSQTYQDLEIILIDDGSPDRSGEICDTYAMRDSRIRVIHKKNAGVACARNDGLDAATGEYISFIDSDDWIETNAYELLHRALKDYEADCSVGGCIKVPEKDGDSRCERNIRNQTECQSAEETLKSVLLKQSALWNRLFRRSVFEHIRFPQGRINDDEVVVLRAYAECKKIVFIDQETYYYRIRSGSITTSGFSIRNVDCYYNSIDNMEFIRNRFPKLLPCAEYKFIKTMLYCYVNLRHLPKDTKTGELKARLKHDIRTNRSLALKNSYVGPALKLLMILCSV